MIPRVTCENITHGAGFKAHAHEKPENKPSEGEKKPKTKALKSNLKNRMVASYNRTKNAFLEYPVKGLAGDVNSNFYEFLAMGRVPYIVGSATFIGVFNAASKYFEARDAQQARIPGLKFAAGVILYALAKTLSKEFISRPVAWATGVDIEQPYVNVIYPFPKVRKVPPKPGEQSKIDEKPQTEIQYQKLWESKEFPRLDLVSDHEYFEKGFFDKVARKNGLGTNLNCAETEAKPILRNIISTTTTAQRISSFLWAACGVGLAACGNWDSYYDTYLKNPKLGKFIPDANKTATENFIGRLKKYGANSKEALLGLKDVFKESGKELWNGAQGTKGFKKHAGKALVLTAVASTVFGVANTIIRARAIGKNLCNEKIIDNSKDSVAV